jgi:sterol desaturase/sphingolipid hydroxylase (fatty acid hydroxylase superfamily)
MLDSFIYLNKEFVIYFFLFLVLERLFAARRQAVFRKEWLTDILHYFVTAFLVAVSVTFFGQFSNALLQNFVNVDLHGLVRSQPDWLQYIEAIVLVDFLGWLYHFASHRIPFLWRLHTVHHSPQEMDWLIAARFHPLEICLSRIFKYIPYTILGFSFEPLAIILFLDYFLSMFVHSNIRFGFKFLNPLITTPQFHHWHHANQGEAYDKNFAPTFPIWDIIFRTYYVPQGKFPEKYGVNENVGSNYLLQLIYPFLPKNFTWNKRPVKSPAKRAIITSAIQTEAVPELVTAETKSTG